MKARSHRIVEFFARHFASVPLLSIGGRWFLILLRMRGETWRDQIKLFFAAAGDLARVLRHPRTLRNPWAGPSLRLRTGDNIRCITRPNSDDIYSMMPWRERDVEGFIREALMRAQEEGGVFVDVGANVGYYSILASRMGVPALAVEAHPQTFSVLQENLRLNRCQNVTPVHRAIWNRSGLRVNVVAPGTQYGMAAVELSSRGEVETVTLDDLLEPYEKIGLVKLDVEGAELQALEGAHRTLKRTPFVVLEALDEAVHREVQEILRSYGFSFRSSRFSRYILAEKL